MKGYLYTRVKFIRGLWHCERRVNGRWVIKTCVNRPVSEDDINKLFEEDIS